MNTLLSRAVARARSKTVRPAQPGAAQADAPNLIEDQRGALTFIEWVIIFAVVIVVIAIAAGELAETVDDKMGEIGDTVEGLETSID
jgi:Flp pilus assembly pilin Flp